MEDLIAIVALAIECAIVTLVARSLGVPLPFGIAVAVFVVLAFIGLGMDGKLVSQACRFVQRFRELREYVL